MSLTGTPPAPDAPREAVLRAAWLYYAEGMTQARIARELGVARARVIAWLALARDEGLVAVRIARQGRAQRALEEALRSRFGLDEAVVVPAPAHAGHTAALVGHAAGAWLCGQVREGMAFGVGWGATLHASLKAVGAQPVRGVSVVSLLGATTLSRTITPPAVARRMADAFGAECYQLTAPLVVADESLRATLWAEPGLADLRARVATLDLALVSVGGVREEATLFRGGLLPRGALASLRQAGAVGDVLCQFVDAQGRVVDHPVNRRTMAVDLGDLARVPRIAVASGGRAKVPVLRAALQALPVRVLVTDEVAAAGLLDA
jgi:DNA-binding transcriptional regulator LsrR (DeoR family)